MPTVFQKPAAVFALMLIAVAVLLHGNLTGPFYRMDDMRYVTRSNEGTFIELFRAQEGIVYAPVTFMSLRLDRAIFGPPVKDISKSIKIDVEATTAGIPAKSWAWGPRLMNGVYHAIAGFLLWFFLFRLGLGFNTSLLIAFVWTAHPAALESIAWVCERKNVLCAMWGFAALAAWTADRSWRWRWPLVWFLFTLSILSKLPAISFLPALFALELFDPRNPESRKSPRFWLYLASRYSVILVVSVGIILLSMQLFKADLAFPPGGSIWTGLLTDADIFGRYTLNGLVPIYSSFFYGVEPILSLADTRFWLYGFAMLTLWIAFFFLAKPEDRRWVAVGFIWFFGALGPNANIIATAFPMQDRYAYLPLPGLLLAAAVALRNVFSRNPSTFRAMPYVAVAYALLVLVIGGMRSSVYHDGDRLTIDSAGRQPNSGYGLMMATHVTHERYVLHLPTGALPNPELARSLGEALIQFYILTQQTPDYWQFTSPLIVRTECAEIMLSLGHDREAAESLEPVLKTQKEFTPSIDWKTLYPFLPAGFQPRFRRRVDREMMPRGWTACAEGWLKVSFRRDTPPAERLGIAQRAVDHALHAEEYDPNNATVLFLLGRAQLRLSDLLAAKNEMPEARRVYAQARETLLREPIKEQGAELLKNVPEPEPPKPQNP